MKFEKLDDQCDKPKKTINILIIPRDGWNTSFSNFEGFEVFYCQNVSVLLFWMMFSIYAPLFNPFITTEYKSLVSFLAWYFENITHLVRKFCFENSELRIFERHWHFAEIELHLPFSWRIKHLLWLHPNALSVVTFE